MLTEDHARHLLAEAATTIKPGPEPEVEPPRASWRPQVAAAAAVLLVVGVIAAASLLHGGSAPSPATPSPSVTTTTPPVDVHAGDAGFHLGPDQIPPVAGYPTSVATTLLQQHGWVVSERPEPNCRPGTVSDTYPPVGTVTPPGTIIVMTASPPGGRRVAARCRGTANTDPFLLWAEGLAAAPKFTSGVQYVDAAAGVRRWLDAAEAPDPAQWPNLGDLAAAATTPDVVRTRAGLAIVPRTVVAGIGRDCASTDCPDHTISIRSRNHRIMWVRYTLTSDGSIDAVTIHDERTPASHGTVPDVVGNSEYYATERLAAWGYAVTPVFRADCAPAGMISRLAVQGRRAFVAVATSTGPCDDSPLVPRRGRPSTSPHRPTGRLDHYRLTAAQAFIAFASRTAGAPAWSDRVVYTINGHRRSTLTAAQAERAASWDACPADRGALHCPLSPLARIRALVRSGGTPLVAVPPAYSLCLPAPGTLPTPADAASGAVTIMPGHGHDDCGSIFYVTLALDGNDRVSSVDLSLPTG